MYNNNRNIQTYLTCIKRTEIQTYSITRIEIQTYLDQKKCFIYTIKAHKTANAILLYNFTSGNLKQNDCKLKITLVR